MQDSMDSAHRAHGKRFPIGPAADSKASVQFVNRYRGELSYEHFSDPGNQLLVDNRTHATGSGGGPIDVADAVPAVQQLGHGGPSSHHWGHVRHPGQVN